MCVASPGSMFPRLPVFCLKLSSSVFVCSALGFYEGFTGHDVLWLRISFKQLSRG